uniref:Sulfotransferase domain-containing protein n=1 Tax=Megaselia scalaris TaxID=36166 RepID=T1GMP4_MEGSC
MCKNLSRPRLIKSHADIKFLPKQLWTKNPKIMFVVRDPRDAFVSLYHHNKFFFGKTVEESIESFIQDKLKYGNFWPMVLSFYALRHRSNIIFFSYEEMKRNLELVVLKVAKFIGRDYDEGQIRELLEHLDFNSMKSNVVCSHRLDLEEVRKKKNIQKDDIDENACFYRKGKVGSYKDELSEEILNKIDKWQKNFLDCEGIYLEDILWSNGHVEHSEEK